MNESGVPGVVDVDSSGRIESSSGMEKSVPVNTNSIKTQETSQLSLMQRSM